MKLFTVLALSSMFATGFIGSLAAHEHHDQKVTNPSDRIRVVSLRENSQTHSPKIMMSGQPSNQTACLSFFSAKDMKRVVEQVLEQHPEMLMKILEDQSIRLAELVERGSMMKVVKEEEERRLDELAHPKVADIDTNRPIRGNPHAKITIVEYSDFECPFCEAAHTTVKKVLEQYGQEVRFVYKHNPLSFHALAEPAARYFEAIALQDPKLSWEFHDRVFEAQSELGGQGEEGLQAIAQALSIDQAKLAQDLTSDLVDKRLAIDLKEAQDFGFDGTPAFLVNGVSLMGNRPLSDFEELIELAIGQETKDSDLAMVEAHQ